jgi:CubicO group peptidase (beta-lactamase class C family)
MSKRTLHASLSSLAAALLTACAALPVEPLDLRALDATLTRMERRGMVGQVLVAREGVMLYGRGVGTLRPDTDERVTLDTVFPLASLTKPLTAAAVITLAADGRLALDDALGRYLEDLTAPWADIPVASLLAHTAGVSPEIGNREWEGEPRFEPVDRQVFLKRVQQFPPRGTPGRRFRYSNVGYGLLGALIEAVSEESFEAHLRRRLLVPAGLEEIGFLLPEWSREDVAVGRVDGVAWGTYFDHPALEDGAGFNLRASGDLHAPAGAVLDWWRKLRAEAWLPPEWARLAFEQHVREPGGSWYGYGWQLRDTPRGRVIGHTGGDHVYAVDFSWYPEDDVLVYVATAEARFEADVIREELHARLFRRR